jgi:hypothetical protein
MAQHGFRVFKAERMNGTGKTPVTSTSTDRTDSDVPALPPRLAHLSASQGRSPNGTRCVASASSHNRHTSLRDCKVPATVGTFQGYMSRIR